MASISVIRKRIKTYERLIEEQANEIEKSKLNATKKERLQEEMESKKSRK